MLVNRWTYNYMTDYAIDVKGMVKDFGPTRVVDNVHLKIPTGQVWGFLGPNGSGKTTTIRMLCGLLTPTEGEGQCLGLDVITQAEAIKLQTGYMTQKFSFWEDLSIRENLEFVARMYNLPQRQKTVSDVIGQLGLSQRQGQLAGDLSGGWKQRLALAAVTMHNPKLLLLDEPTAGVDPKARREFWDQIHKLADLGITILVSTHYMDEAERCDQIVYLAHGKLVTQGTVKEVVESSNLMTFVATGHNVRRYAKQIAGLDDIDNVTFFGSALHVSSTNRAALEHVAKHPDLTHLSWTTIQPSLEDVFIALMKSAGTDKRHY